MSWKAKTKKDKLRILLSIDEITSDINYLEEIIGYLDEDGDEDFDLAAAKTLLSDWLHELGLKKNFVSDNYPAPGNYIVKEFKISYTSAELKASPVIKAIPPKKYSRGK